MRLAAGIEYDGSRYAGWQAQGHAHAVQTEVEAALSRIANASITVTCAGRTDAGVHALGQVVHFDTDAARSEHAWLLGANSHLPGDVSLRWVKGVPDDFNARYSARSRRYRYVILNSRSRSALFAQRAGWCTWPLDAGCMHAAAQPLIGEHDFSGYRAAECQARTAMRRVLEISVTRQGEWVVIDVEANAFLHHMVRNIAGVLIAIGRGQKPRDWAQTVLAGRDRRLGGVTADACGLYFMRVRYESTYGLPEPERPGLGLIP